jgi:hypothetical protein
MSSQFSNLARLVKDPWKVSDLKARGVRSRLMFGALAIFIGNAQAAAGLKVGLQIWNPASPDSEHVEVLVDSPTVISDAVSEAWNLAQKPLCKLIQKELGLGDRLAPGVTLRDIDCKLRPSTEFTAKQLGPNVVEFTYAVRGNTIIATSTTPSTSVLGVTVGAGSYADPRVSLDFDFVLRLGVALQPEPNATLKISEVHAGIENTKVDSQNVAADIYKHLLDAWASIGKTNFIAQVESELDHISTSTQTIRNKDGSVSTYGTAFKDIANANLSPVNNAISVPNNYIKIGAWVDHGKVVLAFAPRNVPIPPLTGVINGHIRWPAGWSAAKGCDSFALTSQVQVAPSAIVGPTFQLDKAPLQNFGQFAAVGAPIQNGATNECQYRIAGVPAIYANKLVAGPVGVNMPGQKSSSVAASILTGFSMPVLRKDGWNEDYVVPSLNAANRDFVVEGVNVKGVGRIVERPSLEVRPAQNAPLPSDSTSASPTARRMGDYRVINRNIVSDLPVEFKVK